MDQFDGYFQMIKPVNCTKGNKNLLIIVIMCHLNNEKSPKSLPGFIVHN